MGNPTGSKYNITQPITHMPERSKAQKSYFFLEQKLYRVLRQDRAGDILTAWSFGDESVKYFVLSDAKSKMKNAYSTSEVARLLNRRAAVLQNHLNKGAIVYPARIYPKGKNIVGVPFYTMKWSEDDVLAMHEYIMSIGRPYADGSGVQSPVRFPSRAEVRAMMRSQAMFYMQTADGEFIPIWSAKS